MKKIFGVLVLVLAILNTVLAQEIGEGDLFMQSLSEKEKADLAAQNATIVSQERYVVSELFSGLPLEEVKLRAKNENKKYYIDFSAEWCQPCKLMDKTTFRDYEVVKFTKENFYAIQLDMSDFDAIELQAMYNVNSLPTILFFDSAGNLIGRTTGLQTGTLFLSKLKEINRKT